MSKQQSKKQKLMNTSDEVAPRCSASSNQPKKFVKRETEFKQVEDELRTMPFGCYKNMLVKDVCNGDPDYAKYLLKWDALKDDMRNLITKFLKD